MNRDIVVDNSQWNIKSDEERRDSSGKSKPSLKKMMPILNKWRKSAAQKKAEEKHNTGYKQKNGQFWKQYTACQNKQLRNNKFFTRRDQRRFSLLSNEFVPEGYRKEIYRRRNNEMVIGFENLKFQNKIWLLEVLSFTRSCFTFELQGSFNNRTIRISSLCFSPTKQSTHPSARRKML